MLVKITIIHINVIYINEVVLSHSELVEIKLCIGLVGVCVISITSNSDLVWDHITSIGAERWYSQLPEHSSPVEGVYIIHAKVECSGGQIKYTVLNSENV